MNDVRLCAVSDAAWGRHARRKTGRTNSLDVVQSPKFYPGDHVRIKSQSETKI